MRPRTACNLFHGRLAHYDTNTAVVYMTGRSKGDHMMALLQGFILGTLFSAYITSAEAQDRPTSRVPQASHAAAVAAAKEVPPTNDFVIISREAGEVVSVNAQGFVLKAGDNYLPRVAFTNASQSDLRALLESKTAYDALTAFHSAMPRTEESKKLEAEMHHVWRNGHSLSEKIQTRAMILDLMRAYNDSIASYRTSLGMANDAVAINQSALSAQPAVVTAASNAAVNLSSVRDARYNGDVSRHEVHDAWRGFKQANGEVDNNTVRINGSAGLANSMQQNAETYWRNCDAYARALDHYGVSVPTKPSYEPIPSLLMRFEVDVARVSSR